MFAKTWCCRAQRGDKVILPVAAKTLSGLPRALRREDHPAGPQSTFRPENGADDHALPADEGMKWRELREDILRAAAFP